jgi:hypothetical protein
MFALYPVYSDKLLSEIVFGGKTKMKRIVITWALTVGLFGFAAITKAEPVNGPFVNISTTPDEVDLGTVPITNNFIVPGALTVNVESNCVHGPIMISSTKLKRRGGCSISPEHIFVKSPATNGFVAMARPVEISKSTLGSHKIVLDFKVEADFLSPAGEYSGTLMITMMPPS